ncbi:MAG: transcription termination/antitermination NusG family protein [Anaerolineales bacterium]|nr:transcription termination/antitermination NusG family protein [Anaerolineales bacterium]
MNRWYALRSKPRKEDSLYRQARAQGFEVYYPRLRVHPVNPRSRKVKPYFPGYMFVQADIPSVGLSTFQWMPYSSGLVCFGEEPAEVPEHLIQSLKKRIAEISAAGGEVFDGLKPGDTVMISDGPFAGYEAIFDARISGSERVRVLLKLLNDRRKLPVELSAGQIARKKSPRA